MNQGYLSGDYGSTVQSGAAMLHGMAVAEYQNLLDSEEFVESAREAGIKTSAAKSTYEMLETAESRTALMKAFSTFNDGLYGFEDRLEDFYEAADEILGGEYEASGLEERVISDEMVDEEMDLIDRLAAQEVEEKTGLDFE